ncbi:hypothetical protein KZX37_00310 [Microbacterium sp. EYE_5]|uniref:hypothetical protein n=1 Tax=unclassified Microbacterium TaxID=2609290 RepID=UPI002004FF22|nr:MULTISPECIES: hypothetical protein [unclassified Microbacterium]MCK6079055.1 hypothetical protein [Microbacterium sp. EYE_382]MCK6084325.1 hypothetical protein [Microbacterium sp. EYE_384]MCK6123446.1 hypothetical protein [Microbacterium sp. EYE_80]MCK6125089.1 hypothetical protein [Microbacterium sp. EYE_79]MCK6140009.1 hypothetical protein [Microbacterium sp. EYE_39]
MARRSPVRRGLPSAVVAVLVVALAVGVAGLVALALDRGRGDNTVREARPLPTLTPGTTPDAEASPTPEATASPIAAPGADERFLAAGTDTLWRATAGACGDTAPTVERSDDDGESWVDVTPTYRGIAQVRDLLPFAETEADLVADVDADCETQALRTFTQGTFWSPYEELLPESTYLDGATAVIDGEPVDAPCETPWSLRAGGDIAALICDGTAWAIESGETSELGDGVIALDVLDGDVVAALVTPDCDGVQLAALAPEPADLECVSAEVSSPAALALSSDAIRLWAGDELTVTAR